jgi:protein-tyrosine kinase
MSSVYEALKKAEREGRLAQANLVGEVSPAPAQPPESALAGNAGLGGPNLASIDSSSAARPRDISEDGQDTGPETVAPSDPALQAGNGAIATGAQLHEKRHSRLRNTAAASPAGTTLLREWWRLLVDADGRRDQDSPALIAGELSASRADEKFHLLRVWFENWTNTNQKRVIMVTSAVPGEGKSFVSLNLAVTLANAGFRVLLVDADLRRPCLHRSFNLVPLRGLLTYLQGTVDFAQCLNRVTPPNLTLVAAGGSTLNASGLMAGPRMAEFIDQARALEPPHYVILDAPAALATPETEILAGVVDAALMVVAANHTPREMVRQAYQSLRNTATCGVVLNRFEPSLSTARKVGYGYYGSRQVRTGPGLY